VFFWQNPKFSQLPFYYYQPSSIQNAWPMDHSKIIKKFGKPFILGEYGGNICWPAGREGTELFLAFMNHINHKQPEPEP